MRVELLVYKWNRFVHILLYVNVRYNEENNSLALLMYETRWSSIALRSSGVSRKNWLWDTMFIILFCFENLSIAITLEPPVRFRWGFQQNVPLLMRTSIKQSNRKQKMTHVQLPTDFPRSQSHHNCRKTSGRLNTLAIVNASHSRKMLASMLQKWSTLHILDSSIVFWDCKLLLLDW